MDRSQILTYIFPFLTIFILTILTSYSFALPQVARKPESTQEEEIASLFHTQILNSQLHEFVETLDTYPQYIDIAYPCPWQGDYITPLQSAAILGRDLFIDELLKREADPSLKTPKKGNTILHLVHITHIMQRFIDLDLNLEARNNQSMTPLLAHIYQRQQPPITTIHALLEADADPNTQTKDSKLSPLHALFKSYYEKRNPENLLFILKDLLAHGARVDIKDKNGAIPLHSAANKNNVQAIRIFVDEAKKKDIVDIVNIRDSELNTPLFAAYQSRSRQAFTALLRRGANPLLINRSFLSVNGEAHRKIMLGSRFSRFVLNEIAKYFRPSDKCIQELIRKQEASAYASN